MAVYAETVLRNGTVWCGRQEGTAQAVALWGGRVLATGSDAEIAPLIGPETRLIDLRGRLATPGLIDAHLHLLPYGLGMREVDVRPKLAPTLDDLLGRIKARADELGPGKWVLARGYDQFKLDVKRHPWREELDRVAPNNPVHLVRTCGHISICNTKALALAGVTTATPAPPGGLIEVQNGQLTGLLAENGRDPIRQVLPAASDADLVDAIERAGQYLVSLGVTSCMDAAVGMHGHFREIGAYFTAEREGRLPVRTSMCLLGDPGPKSIVPDAHRAGLVTGVGHDMLRIGPVKIFTDGSAGGRTAWMSQAYLGDDKTFGVACQTDDVLDEYVMDYHRKGYQMAIHAIGDAAIEQVLVAYERALAAQPDADRRHRIEHCGFLTADHTARMQAAGVYPAPQPIFIHDFGDLYYSVVGTERADASYPMRGWFNAGLKPSASTDAPVCDANPFPNIYTMMTRRTGKGTVVGGHEALTVEEALQAYTEYGAFAEKAETRKGRLAPGMLGDVAVFSRDMLQAAPEEILEDTRCDITIRGGEVVFDRRGETDES
jgi:predicted amidohydrolase YtcJ